VDTVPFLAFVATRADDAVHTTVEELDDAELPPGDVLVDVEWSSVNYKDAMVTLPGNRVARRSPLVPGVDLAGRVLESTDPSVPPGMDVVVHGYDLGVGRHGGFATRARVPAAWVVPLPGGLTTRRAAAVGTAGFTAVLSVEKLKKAGVRPGDGQVLVTGASGGVGSMAVAALARQGYEVVASTGKGAAHEYLRSLGASDVVGRDGIAEAGRVLSKERWSGAIDCVGGDTLAATLRALSYGGAVAASGLTAGPDLHTSVFPFIVRGVSLLGVDSVQTPIGERRLIWSIVQEVLPGATVDAMVAKEVGLHQLASELDDVLAARVQGRVLVRPTAR
jgi:acrylyl-CoA reductase (NADPH)